MNLFGVGPTEIFVVLIVILVLFGPDKLPELAKKIGGASREIRDGLDSINEQMNSALEASMEIDKAQMIKPAADAPAPGDTNTPVLSSEASTAGDTQPSALPSEAPAPADNPVIAPWSDKGTSRASATQAAPVETTRPADSDLPQP